ncbi:hypothetical protein CYMTET_23671 [Cymbomonas tetramitiformis]|uniref:Uncharacterized protein n=1 Tax=Cymbomonas tetramitiformis TaxID=36881 RepID=A0AAE0FXI1_9CHLO|nr:hypothetical protein CYMTET_23671 [Cymbomonas tetramitiformis]
MRAYCYSAASPFKTLTPNLVNRFSKSYLKAYRPRNVEGSYANAIHAEAISCLKRDIQSGAITGSSASVSKRETLKAFAALFFSNYWSEQSRNVALAEGQPVGTIKVEIPRCPYAGNGFVVAVDDVKKERFQR